MISLHITHTGKSYSPKDTYSVFHTSEHDFKNVEEAKDWLKEKYGTCKRYKMYIDDKEGESKHIGYIYGFRNSDISHYPVENWLQQDWVEFREVKLISPNGG